MPKYVECVSDSDEEIVIVPFVKPTPPLIDLIDEEEEKKNESSKKATKKKSKKKIPKTGCPENAVNKNVANANPSVVTGSSDDPAEKTGRNEERNLRSKNVAGPSKAADANKSTAESVSDSAQHCDIASSSSSHMAMLSNSLPESVSNCDIMSPPMVPPEGDSNNPASKAKGRRRNLRPLSHSSATKKTAAEITSFLNTLGIPVEVRDLTPLTPVRPRPRVSRIKRKSLELPLSEETVQSATSTPSVSNLLCPEPAQESQDAGVSAQSEEAEIPSGGFVQVTQEKNSPTKKKSKIPKKKPSEKTPTNNKPREVCVASSSRESTLQGNLISNFVFPTTVPQRDPSPETSTSSSATTQMVEEPTAESSRKRKRKNSRNSSDDQSSSAGTPIGNENNLIVSGGKEDVGNTKMATKKRSSSGVEDNGNEKIKSKKTKKSSEGGSQKNIAEQDIVKASKKKLSKSPINKKRKSSEETSVASVSSNDAMADESGTENQSKNQTTSDNSVKNKKVLTKEKSLQEAIDSRNMPPPLPRTSKVSEKLPYFANHSGFPSGWSDDMKAYYGTFNGIKFDDDAIRQKQSNALSLWRTPEDLRPRRREFSKKRCVNCHQYGHFRINCPEKYKPPRCTMCGGVGHTVDDVGRKACPESCCLNCGTSRERFSSGCSRCTYRKQQPQCTICGVNCHDDAKCPDNWRRYHSITTPLPESVNLEECLTSNQQSEYKRRYESWCSNCSGKGHNYYHCQRPRYKSSPYHRHKPFVVQEFDLEKIEALQQRNVNTTTDSVDSNNSLRTASASVTEKSAQNLSTSFSRKKITNSSEVSSRNESSSIEPSSSRTESAPIASSSTRKESAPIASSSTRKESAPIASSSSRTESAPISSSSTRNESAPIMSSSRNESAPIASSSRKESAPIASSSRKELLPTASTKANISSSKRDFPPGAVRRTEVVDLTSRDAKRNKNESIRVQIQNDAVNTSAIPSDESDVDKSVVSLGKLGCVHYPECSNKISGAYLCQHIAVNPYQQTLLLKAKRDRLLSPIEARKNVSISVLTSVLQVHIVGPNWKDAENELYDLLFMRAKEEEESRNKANINTDLQVRNVKSMDEPNSPGIHRTSVVDKDGANISVRVVENLLLSKPPLIIPEMASMDVDERFASAQDLLKNIPIIDPDGPFAPGTYVPYSMLSPALVSPVSSSTVVPVNIQLLSPTPSSSSNPSHAATSTTVETSFSNSNKAADSQNKSAHSNKFQIKVSKPQSQLQASTSTPKKTPSVGVSSKPITFATIVDEAKKQQELAEKEKIKKENVTQEMDNVVTITDSDDDIMIIEEIIESPAKKRVSKQQDSLEPGLNVVLLPSEYKVIFAESLKKDGILQNLARIYEVTIFVSNESNSCTIHGGFLFAREQARKQVTLWLGCQAAKKTYVIPEGKFVPNPLAKKVDDHQASSSSAPLQSPPSASSVQVPDPSTRATNQTPIASGLTKNVRGRSPGQAKENFRLKRKGEQHRYNPRPNLESSPTKQRNHDPSARGGSSSPSKRGRVAHRIGFRGGNGARRSHNIRGHHTTRPNSSATPNKRFRYFRDDQ